MLNDLHLNTLENEGASTSKAASPKSHQEHAKELEDFIRKRIDLFEQYKAREDAQVLHISYLLCTGSCSLEHNLSCHDVFHSR